MENVVKELEESYAELANNLKEMSELMKQDKGSLGYYRLGIMEKHSLEVIDKVSSNIIKLREYTRENSTLGV